MGFTDFLGMQPVGFLWRRSFNTCCTLYMVHLFFLSKKQMALGESLLTDGFQKEDDPKGCLESVGFTYSGDPLYSQTGSLIKCAAQCLRHGGCSKFLFCSKHQNDCIRIQVFGVLDTTGIRASCGCYVLRAASPCENGGKLVGSDCVCLRGFFGPRCENVITGCAEGYDRQGGILSASLQGTAYIQPLGSPKAFPVHCLNHYGGYTYILRRVGDGVSFNRTWDEYVRGFGDIERDYWIGLEQIHMLTRTQMFLNIGYIDGIRERFTQGFYRTFTIEGLAQDYVAHVSQFFRHEHYPDFIDSLTIVSHQNVDGMRFVTFDHNPTGTSCPMDMRSGWWFAPGCTAANLNGPFLTREEYDSDKTQARITWLGVDYVSNVFMGLSW